MKVFQFQLPWISLKFIPKGPIDYKSALVQVVAWHRTGEKPLSIGFSPVRRLISYHKWNSIFILDMYMEYMYKLVNSE